MIARLKKLPLRTLFLIDSVVFSLVTAWILISQNGIMLAWVTLSGALLFYILSFRVSNNNHPKTVKGVIDEVGGRMVHQLTNWKLIMIGKTVEVWAAIEQQNREQKQVIVKFPRQDMPNNTFVHRGRYHRDGKYLPSTIPSQLGTAIRGRTLFAPTYKAAGQLYHRRVCGWLYLASVY